MDVMMPLREQMEVMYIRCVLKPVVTRVKKLKETPNFNEPTQNAEEKKEGEESDAESEISEKENKTEIENLNFEQNE